MKFPITAAELNARDQIVMSQPARTCAYYEKALETCDVMHRQERARILKEWKESGTWKDKYETWGAACELAAGLSRSHVNNLIADLSVPTADKQATAEQKDKQNTAKRVSRLPDPKDDPSEEDEKPAVRAATPEQMKRKPEPEPEPLSTRPPMDASGAIIPQHLLAMRERRDEITALETAASKLRALFERLQTDPDIIYGHILASGNVQHFERSASSIRHNLAECLPDIVCPRCEGSQNGKPCEYCCGSGWIAEVRWNREWVKSNGSMEKAYVAKRAKNL